MGEAIAGWRQKKEHLDWAEANERFADTLDLSDPVVAGWAITDGFYAAVHYIEGYFASYGIARGLTHSKRDAKIREDFGLGPIWEHYRRLKDMSRDARYDLRVFAEADYLKAASYWRAYARKYSTTAASRNKLNLAPGPRRSWIFGETACGFGKECGHRTKTKKTSHAHECANRRGAFYRGFLLWKEGAFRKRSYFWAARTGARLRARGLPACPGPGVQEAKG